MSNAGVSALPDMYTWLPGVHSGRGRVRIYQARYKCLGYNLIYYIFYTLNALLTLPSLTKHLLFILIWSWLENPSLCIKF